jgi:hypothetical protein
MSVILTIVVAILIASITFFISYKAEFKTVNNCTNTFKEIFCNSNKGQAYIDDEIGEPNSKRLVIESLDYSTLEVTVQAAEKENALVNVKPLTVVALANAVSEKKDKASSINLQKPDEYIFKRRIETSQYPIDTLMTNFKKDRLRYQTSNENSTFTQEGNDIEYRHTAKCDFEESIQITIGDIEGGKNIIGDIKRFS